MSVLLSTAIMVASVGASAAGINVVGSIPCAGSAAVASGETAPISPGQPAILQLRQTKPGEALLVLVVRSNCPYRLQATLPGSDPRQVRIVDVTATPWTGTDHLRAGATDGKLIEPLITSRQAAIWSGPAVSRGGNNSTPDNAVLLRAVLSLPPPAEDVRIVVSLELN